MTGGFPCQDFSFAGKRKGFDSHKDHNGIIYNEPTEATRGQLYLWLKKVVEITKPKVFIAENVKGLVTLGDVKDIIQKILEILTMGMLFLMLRFLMPKIMVSLRIEKELFLLVYQNDMLMKKF